MKKKKRKKFQRCFEYVRIYAQHGLAFGFIKEILIEKSVNVDVVMYTHKKINKHESWLWLEDIPLQMCTAVDGMRNAGKE